MPDWVAINDVLAATGLDVSDARTAQPVSGGDISAAWRLDAGDRSLFIKTGPISSQDMFTAEAEGLDALAATGTLRVPEVIASGTAGDTAFVALAWLAFGRPSRRRPAPGRLLLPDPARGEQDHFSARVAGVRQAIARHGATPGRTAGCVAPKHSGSLRLAPRQHDRADAAAQRSRR